MAHEVSDTAAKVANSILGGPPCPITRPGTKTVELTVPKGFIPFLKTFCGPAVERKNILLIK